MARRVLGPREMEARDANLVGGALNGGTAQLHQQLVFRPVPGLGRAETPVRGLYLGSASAHPGGGVHGACGDNAARAALAPRPGATARAGWGDGDRGRPDAASALQGGTRGDPHRTARMPRVDAHAALPHLDDLLVMELPGRRRARPA